MSAWQPIESAPRDGTHILISFGRYDGVSMAWWADNDLDSRPWKFIDTGLLGAPFKNREGINGCRDGDYGPTHWMPLPPAPSSEELSSSRRCEATCAGNPATDTLLNPPTPSACSELVERLEKLAAGLAMSAKLEAELAEELAGDPQFAMIHRTSSIGLQSEADDIRTAISSLQASQARATAAEGERDLFRAKAEELDKIAEDCGEGSDPFAAWETIDLWRTRAEGAQRAVERLQAIIDWADFAMRMPQEFDAHGVRNLDGPVFDEARSFLLSLSPQGKTDE